MRLHFCSMRLVCKTGRRFAKSHSKKCCFRRVVKMLTLLTVCPANPLLTAQRQIRLIIAHHPQPMRAPLMTFRVATQNWPMNINFRSKVSGFMDMEPLNADPARSAFLKNYHQFISITSDGFPIFMKTVSFIYLSSSAAWLLLWAARLSRWWNLFSSSFAKPV